MWMKMSGSAPFFNTRHNQRLLEAKLRLLIPTQVHHSIGPFRENQFVAVGSVEFGVRCVHRFPRRFFSVEPKDSRGFRLAAEAMHIDLVVTRKSYAGEPVGRV